MANAIRDFLKRGEDNPIRAFLSQQPPADPDVPIVSATGEVAPMRGLLERAAAGEIPMEPQRGLLAGPPAPIQQGADEQDGGLLGSIKDYLSGPAQTLRSAQDPSAVSTFFGRAGRGVADNLMALPSMAVERMANSSFFPRMQTGPIPFEDINLPENDPTVNVPRLTTEDVQAGLGTAAQLPALSDVPEVFSEQRNRFQQQQIREEEENPMSALFGDVTADAVSVAAMRSPLARRAAMARPGMERLAATISRQNAGKPNMDPVIIQKLNQWANSAAGKAVRSGAGKVAESGIEGAVLSAMNDTDPVTGAALAAGQQAGSSALLTASRGVLGNAATTFIGTTALIQMLKEATPGGEDRILETFETSAGKMVALLGLGAVAGLAGGGRIKPDMFPRVADSLTSLPRGAVQSLVREFADPTEAPEAPLVIEMLAQNPDALGTTARRRIERAIRNPDMSVQAELESLSKDRQFRTRLDNALSAPDPRLIGVPVKEDE